MKNILITTTCLVALIIGSLSAAAQDPSITTKNFTKAKPGENAFTLANYTSNRKAMATPKNVLRWSEELLEELNKISPRLIKVSPKKKSDQKTKAIIEQGMAKARMISLKGQHLTPGEARIADKWFWQTMNYFIDECLTANPGSECCFSCNGGQGYQGFWCKANCFLYQFPGI